MKALTYLILTVCIPFGCSYNDSLHVKQEYVDFNYKTLNNIVEEIEINKSILQNSIGVSKISFPATKISQQVSKIHILNAYQTQLSEVISAFKKVLSKTQGEYFKNMNVAIEISNKAKNEISLNSFKSGQLNIKMGLHLSPKSKNNTISTINKERIYKFVADNLKDFK